MHLHRFPSLLPIKDEDQETGAGARGGEGKRGIKTPCWQEPFTRDGGVYKELQRILNHAKVDFSVEKAIELTKTIYQLHHKLPDSKKVLSKLIDLTDEQGFLIDLVRSG